MEKQVQYRTVLMDRSELRALLEIAVELFELSDDCKDPGSGAWVWLSAARDALTKISASSEE